MEQNVRDNNLTTKELTAIADYVRTSFKNKSLYEFFTKDLGVKANFGKNGYMVVSDKISVSKTRNEDLDKCFNGDYDYAAFNRKGTIKAIRLGDKAVKVTNLALFEYVSYDDDRLLFIFDVDEDIKTTNAFAYYVRVFKVY